MLKLRKNVIPNGTIDWTNKVFEFESIIWGISEIRVDWFVTSWYSYQGSTLTLDIAPQSTIDSDMFERAVSDIQWDWMVTLGSLKRSFYSALWRLNPDGTIPQNIQRVYPESYITDELRKSYKRITNVSPETLNVQSYTSRITTWQIVIGNNADNTITLKESLSTDIEWLFVVWDATTTYEYFSREGERYQTAEADIAKLWDKVIVWQKIPYWVKKIVSVSIEDEVLENINEEEFNLETCGEFTIKRDSQGNSYIFLPFSTDPVNVSVKFIPDTNYFTEDYEVIDIPEEYADVIIYDTASKVLMQKEDERWASFRQALWDGRRVWLLYEYQSYMKSKIKKTKWKVKIINDNLYDKTYIQAIPDRRFNGRYKH